jgi:tripartite-type tricarboxylate transporter receptor subunit TctC
VSTAAPDGYRFLETPQSIASFKPIMKVALDPVTELQAIACLSKSPYAIHITATIPVNSVAEMIEYAKKNPETTLYGGTGVGSAGHLYTELFNKVTGTKMRKVDYKSSADVQNDLIAGRVHLYFVTVASTLGQIRAGQLRLIAYTNNSAPKDAPKAPLLAEVGVPGFDEIGSWWGIFAPKGMNPGIIEKANKVINEAILEPEFVNLFTQSSATAAPMSPTDFHKVLVTEVALTEKIMKDANIKLE